jgi:hypothetical protein
MLKDYAQLKHANAQTKLKTKKAVAAEWSGVDCGVSTHFGEAVACAIDTPSPA